MKGLALVSGGIDSAVAAHLMKNKIELVPVYFDNYPYSGQDTKMRAIDVIKKLEFKKAVVVPHGENQTAFLRSCDRKYLCVLCRRAMFKIAAGLAEKIGASLIVTGESAGQVASQTLQNIKTESSGITIPIVRPLIGMDKEEIIKIAKEISTYEISIRPALCCIHVPKKPSTKAALEKILAEEKKAEVEKLIEKSVRSAQLITF